MLIVLALWPSPTAAQQPSETARKILAALREAIAQREVDTFSDSIGSLKRIESTGLAVPILMEALDADDTKVRAASIRSLGATGREGAIAIPHLIQLLAEDDVGSDTALALAEIGAGAVPALTEALSSDQPQARANAAYSLYEIGPEANEAVPALRARLMDLDSRVRSTAALALGLIGKNDRETVTALIAAAGDTDRTVRASAAESLGQMGPTAEEAIPVLGKLLLEDDFASEQAAKSLRRLGPAAVPVLTEALGSNLPGVRLMGAESLAYIGPPARAAVPSLIALLTDEDVDVRIEAARALWVVNREAGAAVEVLVEGLKDPDDFVRERAADALATLGPAAEAAIPALIEEVQHDADQSSVAAAQARAAAIFALGRIGPKAGAVAQILVDQVARRQKFNFYTADGMGMIGAPAVPAWTEALAHEDPFMRETAALCLAKVGRDAVEAVPALIQALEDENSDVRTQAAEALGAIGAAAEEAVPALLKAWQEDEEIRGYAGAALMRIPTGREAAIEIVLPRLPEAVAALAQASGEQRETIASDLGEIGPRAKTVVPALTRQLEDEDVYARMAAGVALLRIEGETPAALAVLKKALESPHEYTRRKAALALGEAGPAARAGVPALRERLNDDEAMVRWAAADALWKIEQMPDTALPVLIRLVGERPLDSLARELAAETLGKMGPRAVGAVPALVRALMEDDFPMQLAAALALRRIGEAAAYRRP